MDLRREPGGLAIQLNPVEVSLLRHALEGLAGHYHIPPAELDEAAAEAWYSTRGCPSAGSSPEDTALWVASLHEIRRAQIGPLEKWLAPLEAAGGRGATLRLAAESLEDFVRAINDYRLLQAARADVGEAEMALDLDEAGHLPAAQRAALLEIHFLGWVMEEILRRMEPG
ncbi:MAG: hypothetical protein RJA22_967 [Verrucomicrobiota bacterium]|jgi:hypothetical protein